MLNGGCFCGAIRYETAGTPFHQTNCHCSICRRTTGAPVIAWVNTPRSSFRVTAGAPRFMSSSAEFERAFCAACGTLMFTRSLDPARWELVSVHHGTIDRAAEIQPAVHICWSDRLPWFDVRDALPRYDTASVPAPDDPRRAR